MLKKYFEEYNLNQNDEVFINQLENFTPSKINLGFKIVRKANDPDLNSFIQNLKEIPEIKNKNILYNENFVKQFYRIFWKTISELAIGTQNFYIFIEEIISELNRITTKDYIINDCRSTDNYNCGRAMIEIDLFPSKFLIFNSQDGLMDINTQIFYSNYKENLKKECLNKNDKIGNNIDKESILQIYGMYGKRILKEIVLLEKKFQVSTIKNQGLIELIIKNDKNFITFLLPLDYPIGPPSGTFNGRTISEIDIGEGDKGNKGWRPSNNLNLIIEKLLNKKLPFSRTLSKTSLKKLCSLILNI